MLCFDSGFIMLVQLNHVTRSWNYSTRMSDTHQGSLYAELFSSGYNQTETLCPVLFIPCYLYIYEEMLQYRTCILQVASQQAYSLSGISLPLSDEYKKTATQKAEMWIVFLRAKEIKRIYVCKVGGRELK